MCHLSETHSLLLNKFNVMPNHVLVVTRKFESQQDPPNCKDLAATVKVLKVHLTLASQKRANECPCSIMCLYIGWEWDASYIQSLVFSLFRRHMWWSHCESHRMTQVEQTLDRVYVLACATS